MCFSAPVSFAASGFLGATGLAVIRRFSLKPQYYLYAAIPFVFALHQFLEGLIWLGHEGVIPSFVQTSATYIYAFIAFSLWPIYVPLCMLLYEWPKRKIIYSPIVVCGAVLGLYLLWCYTVYSPLHLEVKCSLEDCFALSYHYKLPAGHKYIEYLYYAVVTLPFLFSTNPRIYFVVAPLYIISFPLAKYYAQFENFPSLWCFMAALLSVCMFYSLAGDGAGNKKDA